MSFRVQQRLYPYAEIFRAAWQNRDNLPYAWRILNNGVCDGCALGTSGMKDWTIDGIHLCWIRLNLLRLNTMPAAPAGLLTDISRLRGKSEAELRELGRLSTPMVRHRGESGFREIGWEEALNFISSRIKKLEPKRIGFYLVSRGTVNETYYVAQKVARMIGTNHIDNSARVCHAPSTTALKETIGYGATTCSYKDMIGAGLLVFIGSNVANNQPVMMKYLHLAKKAGTKIALINPYREPGMEKYWVPSSIDSALFGTNVCDAFFKIKVGGDIAFLNGVLKHLIANESINHAFIAKSTTGWNELVRAVEEQSFEFLETECGCSRQEMLRFARLCAESQSAIFVWSMGITMHQHGVLNVKAIVNLALALGMIGKPHTGLMPIRGHSGVQGGSEMGAAPNFFPGGCPVNEVNAKRFEQLWGFAIPHWPGYFVSDMIAAAARKELDMLYCVGSNLMDILPDRSYTVQALKNIPVRVHHDIVLNPQMFIDPAEAAILLPATTRYEMAGGNTETSTERRIIFNPEIPGRRIPDARDEWRTLVDIAKRVRPELAENIDFPSTQAIRHEIAQAVPEYRDIELLNKKGDQCQWGGARLAAEGNFATADGKAHFTPISPPMRSTPEKHFRLTTRRGKQFNSIRFGARDVLTGAQRDNIIMAKEDMDRLSLKNGAGLILRSKEGEFRGRVVEGPIQSGTVMMYWPEANVLISRSLSAAECGMPAYRSSDVEAIPL